MPRSRLARLWMIVPALDMATGTVAQQSDSEKIEEPLAAAPPHVAATATVLDWPSEPGADFRILREGGDTWTCLPDPPGDDNFEPMCNDAEWMKWFRAYLAGEPPDTQRMGVSCMLNSRWAVSNLDPAAPGATADNMWVEGGAHLMIIVPDEAMLDQYPAEPGPGAYVMFPDTPWVHLMIPMEELAGQP